MTRGAKQILLLYGLLALVLIPVFPHFPSPNEFSRWATASAIVERGTFEVSSVTPLLGRRFEDLSTREGRVFSNKAPGAALVSLSGYLVARPFVGAPSGKGMRGSLDAMRIAGATLPVLILGFLFVRSSERLGGELSRTPFLLFALLFGTPLFTYGLLLFSHALVALCLFGAWVFLFVPGPAGKVWKGELGAGALLGLAFLSEYPALLPAAVLAIGSLPRGGLGRLGRLFLGALPFGVLLAGYNAICFGGPFRLSSSFEKFGSFSSLAQSGLFGIGWPSLAVVLRLLGDPGKGLLVFSPFLLLLPRALATTWFILPRDAFWTLVLVPLSLLLLYSGYPNWHGGWTVGPRYLVAVLPFLVFPFVFRGGGRLEAALVGAAALAVTLTSLVFPFVPNEFVLPWGSLAAPLLAQGLVAPNLFHLVSQTLAVAVPFVCVVLAASLSVPRRFWGSFAFGATLSAGIAIGLPLLSPIPISTRMARGYLEEVYFERPGALEREMGTTVLVPSGLAARRAEERQQPPTSWPFR